MPVFYPTESALSRVAPNQSQEITGKGKIRVDKPPGNEYNTMALARVLEW
jgi:hypothetical protein